MKFMMRTIIAGVAVLFAASLFVGAASADTNQTNTQVAGQEQNCTVVATAQSGDATAAGIGGTAVGGTVGNADASGTATASTDASANAKCQQQQSIWQNATNLNISDNFFLAFGF